MDRTAATDGLDPAVLAEFRSVLAVAVASDARIRRRDLERFVDVGRRAATGGVPLGALIDSLLSTAWRLWPELPQVRDGTAAQVTRAGQAMLRAGADVCAAVVKGFGLARRELVREQLADRRDFVDDLLLGGAHGISGLVNRAGRFGLDLAGPHAVAVVRADRPFVDEAAATRQVESALLARVQSDLLVATKDGALVVVFGAANRAAVQEFITAITATLPGADGAVRLARTADVGDWRIGVGRPHPGPPGVRLSHQEAVESLALGARLHGLGGIGQVFDSAELDVHRMLIRDEAAMWDLVRSVLEPLREAKGGAEPLLATLEAYFAAGQKSAAAARTLHLSPRAMTYRLARIADLTGYDPTDPAQAFAMHAALLGARLLGWPETS